MFFIVSFYFQTIFELNRTQKSEPYKIMKEKRSQHSQVIAKFRSKIDDFDKQENRRAADTVEKDKHVNLCLINQSNCIKTYTYMYIDKLRCR